jgi:hypothetical protein
MSFFNKKPQPEKLWVCQYGCGYPEIHPPERCPRIKRIHYAVGYSCYGPLSLINEIEFWPVEPSEDEETTPKGGKS